MLAEADENKDGFIQFEEFVKVVETFKQQMQAEAMVEEDRLKAAAREAAREPLAREALLDSLKEETLVGNATQTVAALDRLQKQGALRKWGSFRPSFRPVGADKMKAVTGMQDAEAELGLNVDVLTRARYQGAGFLGLTGAVALVISAFFPGPVQSELVAYGYATLAFNLLATVFAGPIDLFLQKLQLRRTDPGGDRWRRRQAGRLVGAYVCGLPLEKLGPNALGNVDVEVYSRRSGNLDLNELRKSINAEGFLGLGLSDQEVYTQAIVQMTGLVAEYNKYGQATFGYRFFRDLDRQLDLCQRLIDRQEKQVIARFGVTSAYAMLESHEQAVERVAEGLEKGLSMPELIAEIETAAVR